MALIDRETRHAAESGSNANRQTRDAASAETVLAVRGVTKKFAVARSYAALALK